MLSSRQSPPSFCVYLLPFRRGGQGVSGGGGKPEQAEVDAGAVLREGVSVTANPA